MATAIVRMTSASAGPVVSEKERMKAGAAPQTSTVKPNNAKAVVLLG